MSTQIQASTKLRKCSITLLSDNQKVVEGLFSREPITTIPNKKFLYFIRHSDYNTNKPATIEPKVKINRYGCVLLDEPLEFPNPVDEYLVIKDLKLTNISEIKGE